MIEKYSSTVGVDLAQWGFIIGIVGMVVFALLFAWIIFLDTRDKLKRRGLSILGAIGVSLSLLITSVVLQTIGFNQQTTATASGYVHQLEELGLTDVSHLDPYTLGFGVPASDGKSDIRIWPEGKAGHVLNRTPTTVYWKSASGELDFAQVVARYVTPTTAELVVVSGTNPIPLQDYMHSD